MGSVALAALLAAPAAHAISGVLDTVVIMQDVTDSYKWPREQLEWNRVVAQLQEQVHTTERLVQRADRMIELMGTAENAADFSAPPSVMTPVNQAVRLETTKHAIESSRNLFRLGSKTRSTYNPANEVKATFEVAGATETRDENRYAHFAMQEAMYARYRTAATHEEEVQGAETALQEETLRRLKQVKTEAQIAVLTASLAASKQRQDLAHQKTVQAKADLDAFRAQLTTEEARKQEADREWSETVVKRMRDKALTAYRRQFRAVGSESN
ncbi:hypothetical protein DB354_15655 [Opitutus sp. ER46]|nr:hypothetical protein DB354_15655 [Opitutus sp. ER46]